MGGGRAPRDVIAGSLHPTIGPRSAPEKGRDRRSGASRCCGDASVPWGSGGPCGASPAGEPTRPVLAHDASQSGTCAAASWSGARPGRGGRGLRPSGPWPHWGQWVRARPVRCRIHSTALGCARGGGSVGWPRRWRHWRRARALPRLARKPPCRRRWQPWGTIWSSKRRINSWASSVLVCP
jgi:hypothetical protein